MDTTTTERLENKDVCCTDYCSQKFENSDKEIVNRYKCGQKQFSHAESWDIQKNKKAVSIRITL